ncbi:MAG: S8 family serine peptidase, partial [Methylophagaceae bacterium]
MFFTSEFDPASGFAGSSAGYFGDFNFDDSVKSNFLGEYVDIVAVEAGTPTSAYDGHENHVDFQEFDSTNSKFVKMDWSTYNGSASAVENNQVTNSSGPFWTAHAAGVLSAAGGKYCGWGKKSTLRVIYLSNGTNTAYYSVLQWHISKAVNPATGVRNATVVTGAWGYTGLEHEEFFRIDDIASMTVQGGSVVTNRPGGGWGTDLTPFTSNGIIPRVINDPADSTDKWMLSIPYQSRFSSFDTVMSTFNNYNGIYCFKSAGNNSHIAVNPLDTEWNNYVTPDGGYRVLNTLDSEGKNQFTSSSQSDSNQYVLRTAIDGGPDQFTIAACQQDDTNRLLDDYSNRGKMIDFASYGAYTWTSNPSYTYLDGKWGYFSGTSCAAPVAAGCATVFLDHWFTQRGVYPSLAQLKALMIKNAKANLIGEDLIDFTNIPTAGDISSTKLYSSTEVNRVKDNDNQNGGADLSELYGTPALRVHIPWGIRMGSGKYIAGGSEQTAEGRRPLSGRAWPRSKTSFSS